MIKASIKSENIKYKELIYLAWHVEVFHRTKKLPKLETLLKIKKQKTDKKDLLDLFSKDELMKLAEERGG